MFNFLCCSCLFRGCQKSEQKALAAKDEKGTHQSIKRNKLCTQQPLSASSVSVAFSIDAPEITYWNSNPYTIDFSPNGKRIAIGSGGWYGHGGISLVELSTGNVNTIIRFGRQKNVALQERRTGIPANLAEQSLSISGVMFDDSGKYLVVCSRESCMSTGPAFIFEVSNDSFELQHRVTIPDTDLLGVPTGLCFSEGKIFLRCEPGRFITYENGIEDVILPLEIPCVTRFSRRRQNRSHSRIAVVDAGDGKEEMLTGLGSDLVTRHDTQTAMLHPSSNGRITAVLSLPRQPQQQQRSLIITGHNNGKIIMWKKSNNDDGGKTWRPFRNFRDATKKHAQSDVLYTYYYPQGVVTLCALEDGCFFSADASGEILRWNTQGIVIQSFNLPRLGTPRCMAVHPSTPRGALLAVGVKATQKDRRGYVALFRLDIGWEHVGHWILLRRLVDDGRASTLTKHKEVTQKLVMDLDIDIFRRIIGYLIP